MNSQKNKKKNKKQKEEEEPAEEAAPAEEEAEEELVIKSNKKESHGEAKSNVDDEKVNKAVKSIEEVTDELIEQFRSVAQKVLKKTKDDPAAPLAAALAVLTGANKVVTKSLLTQREVCIQFKNFYLSINISLINMNFFFFYSIRASQHINSPNMMMKSGGRALHSSVFRSFFLVFFFI